jgi:PAS domain S-box-containing protein
LPKKTLLGRSDNLESRSRVNLEEPQLYENLSVVEVCSMNKDSHNAFNSTAAVGIIFQLADGSIQSCNPEAERILGYTARQIVAANYFAPPWQTIHRDGSVFPPTTHPGIISLETGKPCFDVTMGFYRANGDLVWLSIATQPLFQGNEDKPHAVVISFREIALETPTTKARYVLSQSQSSTILLIDDNPVDRLMYRRYLGKDPQHQYTFIEAESGESAFDMCQVHSVDLILLDYLLPDMDGLEWLSSWEQQQDRPPVIALTGKGDEKIAVQFLKLGAADYLIKNELTPEKLSLEVNRAIAENRLRTQHQEILFKLQLATDASEMGLWFWDLVTDKLEFTQQCKLLFGLAPDAAMSYPIFLNILHPEDRDRVNQAVERALVDKTEYSIEYRAIWSDGSEHWIAAKGRGFYKQNGEAIRMMGTVQEITERKQTEAELVKTNNILQSIVSDTSDIIFVKDLQGRYLLANQSAAAFLGLSIEEMLGRDDATLFPPEVARSIMTSDRRIIDEGIAWFYEERIFDKTTMRSLFTNKYPWRDATGKILGVIGICRDITSLKQSEQKLKENEKLLRLALASANAGSWDWEIGTENITWSPESYELYGLDPQQPVRYREWENRVHPEDRERMFDQIQRVVSGEVPQHEAEFRIIHPQRGVRWLLARGSVISDEHDNPVRMRGIDLDITDRKQIEDNLRRSERHLRRTIDSLYSFVGVMTPDGILIEANRTALEAANLQLEDVINRPFAETYWWSYDPQIQVQLNDSIHRALSGEFVRYDVNVRVSAEKYILIDFALIPLFDSDGSVEYLIPSGIDVSEREASKQALKESEDELRLITEVIPQQIWTALPNGELDYINQRWEQFTGINLQQIQQRGWEAIVYAEDLDRVRQTWAKAVESGEKYDVEARLRQSDGTYRWFLGRARPLHNERGEIIKWYGTNTDITPIKELEAKLREQTEDLIKANRLKDEFLAIVSHELRTPLNSILGWSQLITTGKMSPERMAQGIETIKRNAKLQTQLIDDLLDVSRILRGKLDLKVMAIDLETIIKSALATVQLSAEAREIEIETEFAAKIGQVSGDPGRLQQIIWNLLSNAIKFTPEGGRVTVTLKQAGTQALIQVRDTGQGISAEFLPYVFDRFRQAENATTRKFGGLGLGLAIVRHLTEIHGGTVAVTSAGEGQGSTFTIKLPLIDRSTSKASKNDLLDETVKVNPLQNICILIVEDETDSRELLTLVLQQQGVEVIPTASAREALDALNDHTFDLIISDIGMPEMDGYTLMTQIRALPQGRNLPAIALTAHAGEVDRQRSLDVGFQQHIAKPINISESLKTIAQLLRKGSLKSEV